MKKIANAGAHVYAPELGQKKPIAQIEATRMYYGNGKYILKTPLELKGQGIKFIKKYASEDLVPQAQNKIGWNEYQVTEKAFNKLKESYAIVIESLLD